MNTRFQRSIPSLLFSPKPYAGILSELSRQFASGVFSTNLYRVILVSLDEHEFFETAVVN